MSHVKKLSRRDVLRLAAVTATGALIAACAPRGAEVIQEDTSEETVEKTVTIAIETPTEEPVAVDTPTQGPVSTETPAPTEAPTEPPAPTEPANILIAKVADVPPGASYDFTYSDQPAILVNFNGEYRSYVNVCTHAGCQTKYYGGEALSCPCHSSAFDVTTGKVIQGPAPSPLRTIEVFVDGDSIYHAA
jgi:nitrite reductase/ring-hydroxylating ferredoxin subunit